jgi:hypothetical protein
MLAFVMALPYNSTMAKQSKSIYFIAQAQKSGTHFSDTAKSVTVTPTPDSKPRAADRHLGDAIADKGRRGWADINSAAKPNTFTGLGGSKSGNPK